MNNPIYRFSFLLLINLLVIGYCYGQIPNSTLLADTIPATDATIISEGEAGVAEPASHGIYFELGFGSVKAALFSTGEFDSLSRFIQKFQDNYGVAVGIATVGNSDLMDDPTEDMLQGYASHLVWTDEERIKNNIVILVDEVGNRSWIYFGTENGKFLSGLPVVQLKKELNGQLKDGEVYQGLRNLLMRLEAGTAKALGQ